MFERLFRNRFGRNRNDNVPAGDKAGARGGRGPGGGVGGGRGQGNKPGSGQGGNCVCPQCGYKQPHLGGQPCMDQTCPQCGTKMVKE